MTFKIRIKNSMYGYERDQIIHIDAESEQTALQIAQRYDTYADVSIISKIK